MTVYKLVDLVGTSNTSFSDAVRGAVERGSRTLQDVRWFEVAELRGRVDKGQIAEFQAKVRLAFQVHAAKDADEHGDAVRYQRKGPTREALSSTAQRASALGTRGERALTRMVDARGAPQGAGAGKREGRKTAATAAKGGRGQRGGAPGKRVGGGGGGMKRRKPAKR